MEKPSEEAGSQPEEEIEEEGEEEVLEADAESTDEQSDSTEDEDSYEDVHSINTGFQKLVEGKKIHTSKTLNGIKILRIS